jgi:hypothetical protein
MWSDTMSWICRFLFNTRQPFWRYCLVAYPLALIPSLFLSAAWYWFSEVSGVKLTPAPVVSPYFATTFFLVVVFSPVLETLLLVFFIYIFSKVTNRNLVIAWLSALLWACMHGAVAGAWFFGVVWNFFIFSCAYLAWRRHSFAKGYFAAALIHALINLSAVLFIFGMGG